MVSRISVIPTLPFLDKKRTEDTKQGESDFHEGFLKKNFNHMRKPKMAIRVCYNFLFLFQQI